MTIQIQPVIMAGGSGTRLWPLSRAQFPKQFLVLSGNQSLFQLAASRLSMLESADVRVSLPIVVVNDEHRFLALDQLREMKFEAAPLLLEPVGRNTAPALTLAALQARESGADPVLVVSPADQTVTSDSSFAAALGEAVRRAADGAVMILGVPPTAPETGYGYIRASGDAAQLDVARFVEKPDEATARGYLAEGNYFWNSGIFVLKASTWLAALEQFRPDILAATRAAWLARKEDASFVRPGRAEFEAIPGESVDYAVIEKCPGSRFDIGMVPLEAGWSDLGAWEAVWQISPKDGQGNSSKGDVLFEDSRGTLVHASSRLVSTVGVDNLIVVETPDAVLVADRSRSQDVKKIVNSLHREGRTEQNLHRRVSRPWGWYDSVDAGARFQVKRIMVKPGARLSLQMHHHRAEHWIVVSGTAEVTNGDKVIMLTENQSTFIPLGQVHRLANPGKVPLEIIEVQSGSYLGEDDIVRFEDTYGRN
jgi:mannose-1-phosphate guanylyltransferase / mannose-6-phosphate isomerase